MMLGIVFIILNLKIWLKARVSTVCGIALSVIKAIMSRPIIKKVMKRLKKNLKNSANSVEKQLFISERILESPLQSSENKSHHVRTTQRHITKTADILCLSAVFLDPVFEGKFDDYYPSMDNGRTPVGVKDGHASCAVSHSALSSSRSFWISLGFPASTALRTFAI